MHVTVDGGVTWADVTPPSLAPWTKVSVLEASPFRRGDRVRGDQHAPRRRPPPHICRTKDGGKTWAEITNGIPDGARSTPFVKTRCGRACSMPAPSAKCFVSFDDGAILAVAAA
jgi:hypothetical protein